MNEPLAFYPWLVDYRAVFEVFLAGFGGVLAVYLWFRAGRDHKDNSEGVRKSPPRVSADLIEIDSNPIPIFVWGVIVFTTLWVIGYFIVTGTHGGLHY